ncbi:MAG: hypothetical protein JSV45_09080 [Chromatiales bacterium]|nr:MAG: hypothetical protein JSV45_09080 [Chromatiales bacterium]
MNTIPGRLFGGLLVAATLAACGGNGDNAVTEEPGVATEPQSLAAPATTPPEPAAAAEQAEDVATGNEQMAEAAAEMAAEVAAVEQVAAQSGEQKAQPCLSCHSLDNFASFDVPKLEAAMQSMRTGEMAHLPLPDSVSDADVAEIAAYLAGAGADG